MLNSYFDLKFEFNINKNVAYEPVWKDNVERWYQLDEASFLLCEAISDWQKQNLLKPFDRIIYLAEGGSNLADADFVGIQIPSPAKFVYTLPNIAPSVFLQLLKWRGSVVCISPVELEKSLKFSFNLAKSLAENSKQNTFILYSNPSLNERGYRVVYGAFVTS